MLDDSTPDPIKAQIAFDAAHRALMDAAPDIPAEERGRLRAEERRAAVDLHAARAGTEWATIAGQARLRAMAAALGE